MGSVVWSTTAGILPLKVLLCHYFGLDARNCETKMVLEECNHHLWIFARHIFSTKTMFEKKEKKNVNKVKGDGTCTWVSVHMWVPNQATENTSSTQSGMAVWQYLPHILPYKLNSLELLSDGRESVQVVECDCISLSASHLLLSSLQFHWPARAALNSQRDSVNQGEVGVLPK